MRRSLTEYVPALFVVDALLVVAHLVLGDASFWNLDEEQNLPTWYSSVQVAFIGVAAIDAFLAERDSRRSFFPPAWSWLTLSVVFFYLSLDELAQIHESLLRDQVMHLFPPDSLWASFQAWQVVLGPFLAATAALLLGISVTRFTTRAVLIPALGGLACWVGAVFTEALAVPFFILHDWYHAEVAIEEGLEIAGATLFLLSFTRYTSVIRRDLLPAMDLRTQRRRGLAAAAALVVMVAVGVAGVAAATLLDPAWLYAYNGWYLADEGMCRQAIVAYQKALEYRPDNVDLIAGIGRCHCDLGECDEALPFFDRAIEAKPRDAKLRKARGMALHELRRFAEAAKAYQSAVDLDPTDANAYLNLGFALEKLDRKDDARAAYRSTLRLDPDERDAKDRLRELDRVH